MKIINGKLEITHGISTRHFRLMGCHERHLFCPLEVFVIWHLAMSRHHEWVGGGTHSEDLLIVNLH